MKKKVKVWLGMSIAGFVIGAALVFAFVVKDEWVEIPLEDNLAGLGSDADNILDCDISIFTNKDSLKLVIGSKHTFISTVSDKETMLKVFNSTSSDDIEKIYGHYIVCYIKDDDTVRISTDKFASVINANKYIFVNTPTSVDITGSVYIIFDKTINTINNYFKN